MFFDLPSYHQDSLEGFDGRDDNAQSDKDSHLSAGTDAPCPSSVDEGSPGNSQRVSSEERRDQKHRTRSGLGLLPRCLPCLPGKIPLPPFVPISYLYSSMNACSSFLGCLKVLWQAAHTSSMRVCSQPFTRIPVRQLRKLGMGTARGGRAMEPSHCDGPLRTTHAF